MKTSSNGPAGNQPSLVVQPAHRDNLSSLSAQSRGRRLWDPRALGVIRDPNIIKGKPGPGTL